MRTQAPRASAVAATSLAILGLASCAPLARSTRAQDQQPAAPREATARKADAPTPDDPLVAEAIAAHNKERAGADLPPLTYSPKLQAAAKVQADDMAEHDKMSHEGSDGSQPADRVKKQDYNYRRMGENVAYGAKSVGEVMRTWMDSPPHKKNILGDFREIGVARALSKDGTPYWCADFGMPWPKLESGEAAGGLVEAINKARQEAKKPAMEADPKLAEVAQRHARDMAAAGEMASKDSDGLTPFDRIKKEGLRYRELAQSDASGLLQGPDVVKQWLDSPGHKANLLGAFSRIGVGYATAKDGTPYWSVIFGRPLPR